MFNRGIFAVLSLLLLSSFARAQERGDVNPIISGPNAEVCFEPAPNAGPDACIKRTAPGVLSVTPGTGVGTPIGSGGGGVVGGTFGGSPSSDYTFTSTPIATSPFSGNLLVGANINNNGGGVYTAGTGWTLAAPTVVLGLEYQTAGAASSYSSAFTYSISVSNWGGTIAAFSATSPVLTQANSSNGITALAYGSNIGAGHLLVAAIRYASGSDAGPISSITDTVGNTWVPAGARALEGYNKGVGDTDFLEFWYAANSIAGADTVTTHGLTGPAGIYIALAEFSGVATSSPLVDYNFTGSNVSVSSIPGATTNNQYLIQAVNNVTGAVDFSGRDSGAVFRSAANAKASTGGTLYFKQGTYPGQTSLQESVAGQTNWYIWGMPAPVGSQQVSWHIVCESFTQILYSTLQTDGCIHLMMPSAYAGPAPSGAVLSGFWQRPSATFGATNNDVDFFVNNTVRIPDNQHTPSVSYDTFTSVYASHVGSVADTAIPAVDQLCSGLTPGLAGVTGFRTNQASTDESYFENTWAVGYNTPYNVLSNHPIGINMHAACNQNAGIFAVAGSLYGGQIIHFQDIHNINGLAFNCTSSGTRFDMQNTVVENAQSGAFTRVANATESIPGNCMGKVDVTTGTANGAANTPGSFFAAGSGTNFRVNESIRLVQPGMITSSSVSAATTGTAKQTLATYTFVYNSNGAGSSGGPFINNSGGVFRVSAWGITAANADSKTVEIDFGGTAISTITSTVSGGVIRVSADIIVGSVANTQECNGYADDGTVHTVSRTSPGIAGNANIILNLAATTGTLAGDFTFKGWTIEYLGGS